MANIKEIDIALFFEREKLTDNAEIQLREMLEFCALPWTGIKAQIREMTIPGKGGDRHGYALSIKGEEAIAWVTQLMRVLRRFTERAHESLAARRGTECFRELYRELSDTMNQLPVEGLD